MRASLPACGAVPEEKPRFDEVGRPEDLLAGVAARIDMFDCVMPTERPKRLAFTLDGPIRLRNARHRRIPGRSRSGCRCYCCANYSRAYLHHLFAADEMLGPTLLNLHNIAFYLQLMRESRAAIEAGTFASFRAACLARWKVDS